MRKRRGFGSIYSAKGGWYVRAFVLGRKLHRRFDTRASAETFLARLKAELDRETATGVRALQAQGFSAFMDEYLAMLKTEHTPDTFQSEAAKLRAMARHFGGSLVSEIRREEVERYLAVLGGTGAGVSTRNRYVSLLSAAFKRAIALGYARENPATGVKKIREPEHEVPVLTGEQQEKLVSACPTRIRPLMGFLLGTGLRLGEALRLEWKDIDFTAHEVRVIRSKNKRTRAVPLTSAVESVLKDVDKSRGPRPLDAPDRVFARIPMSARSGSVRTKFKRAVKVAGLDDGFRIHDLRHVFSINAVRAGVTLPDLAKINGHSLPMAMRYARHVSGNVVEMTRARLEASIAKPAKKARKRRS